MDRADNPLKHAPHTAATLLAADVDARICAASRRPIRCPRSRQRKYWPPVGRADNVYGDRNLFCSCIPVDGLRLSAYRA